MENGRTDEHDHSRPALHRARPTAAGELGALAHHHEGAPMMSLTDRERELSEFMKHEMGRYGTQHASGATLPTLEVVAKTIAHAVNASGDEMRYDIKALRRSVELAHKELDTLRQSLIDTDLQVAALAEKPSEPDAPPEPPLPFNYYELLAYLRRVGEEFDVHEKREIIAWLRAAWLGED